MKCPKCGAECPEGNIFCEACGSELEVSVLPQNVDEKGRVNKKAKKPEKEKTVEKKTPKPKKIKTDEEKEAIAKKLKAAGAAVAAIAVIVIIIMIISSGEASKGIKAAEKIPLGRNLEYAAAESKLEFDHKCDNGIVNSMTSFDYICTSDKKVKVSGSEQPEWAVMLDTGSDGLINAVEYYDFSQLKLNWKGRRSETKLDENTVGFGMNIKNVSKTLGMKPYYIRRDVSNSAVYCYRYYYYDESIGCDRAYNYYVEFSDVDNTVTNVRYSEINYAALILAAGNEFKTPDLPEFTGTGDVSEDADEEADEDISEE